MSGKIREVLMCDKATMRILGRYRSCGDAARAAGVSHHKVYRSCAEHRAGYDSFVFRFADDYDPSERYRDGQVGRPVLMTDMRSGTETVFSSARKAAEAVYAAPASVHQCIAEGRPFDGRWTFDWAR